MIETLPKLEERAVLVALIREGQTTQQVTEYLDELAFLAETAGAITINRFTQKLQHPDVRTFVGSGKLEEIRIYNEFAEINTVIIDDEISPAQQRNIEAELKCKVLDRTSLILDIFSNAKANNGKAILIAITDLKSTLPINLNANPIAIIPDAINNIILTPSLIFFC